MAKRPDRKRNKTVRKSAKERQRRPRQRGETMWDDEEPIGDESYDSDFYDKYAEEAYARDYEDPRRDRHRTEESDPVQNDDEMFNEFSDETNEFYVDEQAQREDRRQRDRRRDDRRSANKKKWREKDGHDSSEKKKEARRPKKEKQRKPISPTQRRIIRIISYGAIIAVVLIVGVILSLTVLFKTQAYEVTGITKYSEQEIIDACGISKGENIFLAPKRPAEKRIKDTFPYVEEAQVSFKIPDTIRIEVEEAVEGYLVKVSEKEFLVISTKGRILNRITDSSEYNLPIFIGPTLSSGEIGDYVSYEDDKVVTMIESITQTFADNGFQGITEIDATDMADISFTYENRIKVKLGIPEDLDYKIRTAMTIITDKIDGNTTARIGGVLDVSRCNTTKRSYFDEQAITPTEAPSEASTQVSATESSVTQGSADAGADNGVTYDGGNYDGGAAYDGGYTYDNGAAYEWNADGYYGGYYADYGVVDGEW